MVFLIIIFPVYAFIISGLIAGAIHILDNTSVGISAFFQKNTSKEDITAATSVDFTINHLAAAIIHFVDGVLWLLHYRYVFICAELLA
ncbi:MAG: hypothetical protein NTX05_02595 [Fusobacteria bacterium]|nr:hypothetical protein [Fusobacteriota bacterium]